MNEALHFITEMELNEVSSLVSGNDRGPERTSNLPEATQYVNYKARTIHLSFIKVKAS